MNPNEIKNILYVEDMGFRIDGLEEWRNAYLPEAKLHCKRSKQALDEFLGAVQDDVQLVLLDTQIDGCLDVPAEYIVRLRSKAESPHLCRALIFTASTQTDRHTGTYFSKPRIQDFADPGDFETELLSLIEKHDLLKNDDIEAIDQFMNLRTFCSRFRSTMFHKVLYPLQVAAWNHEASGSGPTSKGIEVPAILDAIEEFRTANRLSEDHWEHPFLDATANEKWAECLKDSMDLQRKYSESQTGFSMDEFYGDFEKLAKRVVITCKLFASTIHRG